MNEESTYDNNQLNKYSSRFALLFVEQGIIVNANTLTPLLPLSETQKLIAPQVEAAYLCNAVVIIRCQTALSEQELAKVGLKKLAIRPFLTQANTKMRNLALKAYHWLNWDKQSRYCGQCGAPLKSKFEATDKYCENCKTSFFPRFSPAIMVLVQKGKEILLGRSKHFVPGVYSALAGFVDIGETAEMAVHREVKEEVGIDITHLRYFSSQTWPFPDSFMIAFNATYAGGELKIDNNELEDARWFSLDALPTLPSKPSIARRLIDNIIKKQAT